MSSEFIIGTIVALIIAGGLAFVGFLLLPYLLKLFRDRQLQPVDQTTDEVLTALDHLEQTLGRLQRGGEKAGVLIQDAQVQALSLVQLVRGFALRADDFRRDIDRLQFAQKAVVSGDSQQIAEAAGYVDDAEISQLLLLEARDPQLWLSINKAIANQIGVLRRWEETYIIFSTRLIADVSEAKSRVAQLQSSLDLLSAADPLARIQANLNEANRVLQLRREPEVGRLAEGTPTVAARLLR